MSGVISYFPPASLGGFVRLLSVTYINMLPFSKRTNPLQGCDPYDPEILRNKL